MAKYTDEQIKKALELCVNWEAEYCEKCPFDDECDNDGDTPLRNALDLIKRQEAEKAELQRENCELKSKIERVRVEVAELNSNLILLRNDYELCRSSYEEYKAKVAILNDKLITAYKLLKTAKSAAIKEYIELLKAEFLKDCKGNDDFAYFVFGYIDKVAEMVGESK